MREPDDRSAIDRRPSRAPAGRRAAPDRRSTRPARTRTAPRISIGWPRPEQEHGACRAHATGVRWVGARRCDAADPRAGGGGTRVSQHAPSSAARRGSAPAGSMHHTNACVDPCFASSRSCRSSSAAAWGSTHSIPRSIPRPTRAHPAHPAHPTLRSTRVRRRRPPASATPCACAPGPARRPSRRRARGDASRARERTAASWRRWEA